MKLLIILILLFSFQTTVSARTTPQDILNSQSETYNKKIQTYSPVNKQKLENLSGQISALNKKITDELSQNMETQGEILEEYMRRNGIKEKEGDGITRNLQDPVENARYFLTFAHEAVAYQAAKTYVFNLSAEENLKKDANSTISVFESDINGLIPKVLKSKTIIKNLVTK